MVVCMSDDLRGVGGYGWPGGGGGGASPTVFAVYRSSRSATDAQYCFPEAVFKKILEEQTTKRYTLSESLFVHGVDQVQQD